MSSGKSSNWSVETWLSKWTRNQLFCNEWSQVTRHGISSTTRSQSGSLEHGNLPAHSGKKGSVPTDQRRKQYLKCSSISMVSYISSSFLRVELSVRRRMLQFSGVFVMQCDEKDTICSNDRIVSCIMTMPGTLVTIGERIPRKAQNTCSSIAAIFSRSCTSRFQPISKGQIPTKWTVVCVRRKVKIYATRTLRKWPKMDCRNVSRSGTDAGRNVLLPRGCTLKVVLCKWLHVICNKCFSTSSITFWLLVYTLPEKLQHPQGLCSLAPGYNMCNTEGL